MSLREYQRDLTPGFLRDARARAYLEELGGQKDALLEKAAEAIRARLIALATDDALNVLGVERGLPRYSSDTTSTYRARVQGAWNYWAGAGTVKGLVDTIALAGYTATIIEAFRYDPIGKYADFSVILHKTGDPVGEFGTGLPKWGVAGRKWGSGGKWGVNNNFNAENIVRLILRFKSTHSRLRSVIYKTGTSKVWGEPGRWGVAGRKWGGTGTSTLVYSNP